MSGVLEEAGAHASRERAWMHSLDVTPWAEGERDHWLRLVPSRLTGRRVGA